MGVGTIPHFGFGHILSKIINQILRVFPQGIANQFKWPILCILPRESEL